ncbi:MAG: phosphoglucosamine mutase [Gemmatimonadales bacterium]|nr:phosphoglucosamine mutase [Gemmatimonadales bacterium]
MVSSTLMNSVSGMRGIVGKDLTPELVARQAAALAAWCVSIGRPTVCLGRDSRTSGAMYARAAAAGIQSAGATCVDCGLSTTPSVQIAVDHHRAGGGIMITASHNPIEWNAIKFMGPDGVFLDHVIGDEVKAIAERGPARGGWDRIGRYVEDTDAIERHIEQIVALHVIDLSAIRARKFTVAIDTCRGAGGVIIPKLLDRFGVKWKGIHLQTDGKFPRPPEPVPESLGELSALVRETGADLGFALDPDVDRCAIVDASGRPIGEDYTLALGVHSVLHDWSDRKPPTVVANLSTSLVVADAAAKYGAKFVRAPVGEANVARVMRDRGAYIGGEGNGGVIFPDLHVGRDAPLAVALVLQLLTVMQQSVSAFVENAPRYVIVKDKGPRGADLGQVYAQLRSRFPDAEVDERDGLHLAWKDRWLHVRPSGTEPIIRYIAEGPDAGVASGLIAVAREIAGD